MLQRIKKVITCINLQLKQIDRHDSDSYWPNLIKDTIQWFPFLAIIEHTENILKKNKKLIPSLLKLFSMFQLRTFDAKHDEKSYAIAIKCINYNKETGLNLNYTPIE